MTTQVDAAQARHQQAIATLAAAEAELLAAMRAIEPAFTGMVEAMRDRRWESRLEGPRPLWELSQAYGAYRRAQRQEAKARLAALRAQAPPAPAQTPAPKPARRVRNTKSKKVAFVDHARVLLAEEAARVAA
jgi:hypothetical protein